MKKILAVAAILCIVAAAYAVGCECCKKGQSQAAAAAAQPQQEAASTNAVQMCTCQCPNCMKVQVTEMQKTTVVTNTVSVKEYKCGNKWFGASVTVTEEPKVEAPPATTVIYHEQMTYVAPQPPPPPTCQVWVEGSWGWAISPYGVYVRRWIPGHYESCVIIK